MNVTQNKIDDLNSIINITLQPEDYKTKVDQALSDYRKKANIPGFRKGKVPMGMIKKQYEASLTFEEINKVLNDTLSNFITENKLNILGQPLPVQNNDLDVSADEMIFQFEIGLAPEFKVDLSGAEIDYYTIGASDKEIDETIGRMRTQFGEIEESEVIMEDGDFIAEVTEIDEEGNAVENGLSTTTTIAVNDLKNKDLFIGKKIEEEEIVTAQELFADTHQLQHSFGLSHEEAHHFNARLKVVIKKPSKRIKAELNQELYDKVYGKDVIKSEEEVKAKVKDGIESYYKKEADSKFMNDAVEWLFENIKFDLPSQFLTKYIKSTVKEPITEEAAIEEFGKSEKALRYQLIEGQILFDNNISIQYQDLKEFTREQMKQQFAMYGYVDIPDNELDKYVDNAMKNEEHVRETSGNLIQQELFKIFDAQVKKKDKAVSLEEFNKLFKEEEAHTH